MNHRILLAAALAALAGAPALGQANEVAANNAAQTVNNVGGDAMTANAAAPAAPAPVAEPAPPPAAPETARAREPASFPWGVLGLVGLLGLIGSRRRDG